MATQNPSAPLSCVTVRTIEGLRVALAGLPKTMPVLVSGGLDMGARTVAEARAIEALPCTVLEVRIPYRLQTDSVVLLADGEIDL